ncbi:mitochondrial glycoprotein [Spinellus fusiger]|nr:mitochondrial glycoprotein [Spinellus fusiger]
MASHLLRASLRGLTRPVFRSVAPMAAHVTPRLMTPLSVTATRAFSASVFQMKSGSVDSDLVHKLNEEVEYEDSRDDTAMSEFVREFLDTKVFEVEDKPGLDEVVLTRTFGNEKIRILFSISDINIEKDGNQLYSPEEMEGAEEETEEVPSSYPIHASVTIEKGDKGATTIDITVEDGEITIDTIMFYKDGKLATEQTSDADWKRRGQYIGPQFPDLDDGVQSLFLRYLEERGINTALANFLPEYIEYKEQAEYMRWLKGMRDFVSY